MIREAHGAAIVVRNQLGESCVPDVETSLDRMRSTNPRKVVNELFRLRDRVLRELASWTKACDTLCKIELRQTKSSCRTCCGVHEAKQVLRRIVADARVWRRQILVAVEAETSFVQQRCTERMDPVERYVLTADVIHVAAIRQCCITSPKTVQQRVPYEEIVSLTELVIEPRVDLVCVVLLPRG